MQVPRGEQIELPTHGGLRGESHACRSRQQTQTRSATRQQTRTAYKSVDIRAGRRAGRNRNTVTHIHGVFRETTGSTRVGWGGGWAARAVASPEPEDTARISPTRRGARSVEGRDTRAEA